jgi:hypothetical protein
MDMHLTLMLIVMLLCGVALGWRAVVVLKTWPARPDFSELLNPRPGDTNQAWNLIELLNLPDATRVRVIRRQTSTNSLPVDIHEAAQRYGITVALSADCQVLLVYIPDGDRFDMILVTGEFEDLRRGYTSLLGIVDYLQDSSISGLHGLVEAVGRNIYYLRPLGLLGGSNSRSNL